VIKAPNDDYSIIGKPAAEIVKSLTANWHPRVKPLFDEMSESEAAFWKITCSTPSGVPEWQNEPRVTVIGDAAHSMTPAGGIGKWHNPEPLEATSRCNSPRQMVMLTFGFLGANTAVRDSALLGKLLAEAGGYKEGLTAAYENEMRVYASEAVRSSYGMATKQFGIIIDENSVTV